MDKITFTNLSSSTKRNVVYAFLLDFSLRPELNLAIWSYFVRGELGFTQTQALLLSWGAFIIHIIMEIPTGAFADRFSRKTAILIGVFCILLARGSWLAFDGFVVIAIAQVIGGLGSSFASGAYDAIVHDSIAKDIGNSNNTQIESIYSKYLGRKNAVFFVARVTLGLIGAWLFTVNVYLPYWGALIFVAFAGVLAMLLHEEKTDHHKNKQYIKKAVNHVCKNTALLPLVLFGLNYLIVGDLIYSQIQPYGSLIEVGAVVVGILYAIQAILGALSSLLFQRLNLTISSEILSFFFSSLAVLSTLLLLTKNIFAAMLTMSIIGFQGGMMEPMYYKAMKNVPRRIKATVLSVTSFIFHIPAIVSAIIGSIFIDFFDADDSFRYFFYISIVIFFVSALAFIKYRKNKE